MKTSCNIASPEFVAMVDAIEPSDIGPWSQHHLHWPCRLVLKDGHVVERAICVEDHRGFTEESWVHPDAVARIESSPERLPARLATKLYAAGESGMGYQLFTLEMTDGSSHVFATGNVVDFPDYPNGYEAKDVVEVYPHQGREQLKHGYRQERSFQWCFFVRS